MNSFVMFIKQCQREMLLLSRQLQFLINSYLFLLIFLCMIPLTINPDINLLRSIAPGLVWMGILLTLLLSAERLFQQDFDQGVTEQWVISGKSLPLLVSAKVIAHWLYNLVPLMVLCPLSALFFNLNLFEMSIMALTILCGTPALLFLCALVSAFGMGLNSKGNVIAIILLPLTLPILIFGSGIVNVASSGFPVCGHLALLLAISIIVSAFLPFAIAAILKLGCAEH